MYGRIKLGTTCGQDHYYYAWPNFIPFLNREVNFEKKDIVFKILEIGPSGSTESKMYECTAPGFGMINGYYGNGSIIVTAEDLNWAEVVDDVEAIKYWDKLTQLLDEATQKEKTIETIENNLNDIKWIKVRVEKIELINIDELTTKLIQAEYELTQMLGEVLKDDPKIL